MQKWEFPLKNENHKVNQICRLKAQVTRQNLKNYY